MLLHGLAIMAALSSVSSLTWVHHKVPISGQLVLTDVHAVVDATRVVAYATGEAGVLLKLDLPAATPSGQWAHQLGWWAHRV